MQRVLTKILLALGIVAVACTSGELTAPSLKGDVGSSVSSIPATIDIAPPTTPELTIGTSVSLVVTVRDAAGQRLNSVAVIWSSSDSTIASVSATGVVLGRSTGIVTIRASAGGIGASVTINVNPIAVNSVSVTVPPAFFVGDSVAAVALPVDASGNVLTGRIASWSSRNSSIATISAAGVVVGIGAGTTKIDAVVGGVTGTATVVVSLAPSSVKLIAVVVNTPVISIGQTSQATAIAKDSVGQVLINRPVLWTSSNPSVATVSPLGVLTALALGTVVVSASSGGISGSAALTVGSNSALPIATITVSALIPTLSPGQSTPALAVPLDSLGNVLVGPTFTWSSTAPTLATVSSSGVITGVAPGTVLINATNGAKTGSLSMQVGAITNQPPATVTVFANLVNPDTLSPGYVVQAAATLRNSGGTVVTTLAPTTWSSSNPAVATVNSIGVVSAVGLGTAIITATNSGTTGTVTISVIPPPVKTITVSAGTTTLVSGRTTQAVSTLRDTAGNVLTGRAVAWSYVTPAVATVDANGLITAVGPGSGAIVASSEGRQGFIFILVTLPPIASVTLSNATPTLLMGQTTQLSVLILDVNGNPVLNAPMSWASSAPTQATVSQTGLVTALGKGVYGPVIITATVATGAGTVNGTSTVTTIGHGVETLAALPQVYLNTVAPPAPDVGGVVITVNAGGNLQAALNSAQPGDVVALANGATFTGNFILPNKNTASTRWITIRPVNTALLPAEGSRMTPTIAAAAQLPIVLSPTNQGAFNTVLGSHHYRIIGLEISITPANTGNTGLIRLGDGGGGGQTSLPLVAHDLVLDRVFVHGTPTQNIRRAISLQSATSAVIDSYISEIHEAGTDAQAITGWNGPGPYKIVNNYLEASTEIVAFGGADPDILNLVPSDIEIRHNHFFRPIAWKGVWLVKNFYESKASKRTLVEGNLFENNWLDGQGGSAVNLKSTNQNGGCLGCGTQDVTFRYNLIRNTGAGFALSANPDPNAVNFPLQRVTIHDNIITNIDVGPTFNGDGRGFLINQNPIDISIIHNTLISPTTSAIGFGGPAMTPPIRMTVRDIVIGGGLYGVKGPGLGSGNATISVFMPEGFYIANALTVTSASGYPIFNFYPASVAAVGFVNAAVQDFHLSASSTLKVRGSDGRDVGADIDAVNAAIAGVIVP